MLHTLTLLQTSTVYFNLHVLEGGWVRAARTIFLLDFEDGCFGGAVVRGRPVAGSS